MVVRMTGKISDMPFPERKEYLLNNGWAYCRTQFGQLWHRRGEYLNMGGHSIPDPYLAAAREKEKQLKEEAKAKIAEGERQLSAIEGARQRSVDAAAAKEREAERQAEQEKAAIKSEEGERAAAIMAQSVGTTDGELPPVAWQDMKPDDLAEFLETVEDRKTWWEHQEKDVIADYLEITLNRDVDRRRNVQHLSELIETELGL